MNEKDITEILEKSFEMAVNECVGNKEFMAMYRKLTGARLGVHKSGIEAMIDKQTGFEDHEWKELFNFIRDYVWRPWIFKK